MKNIIKLIFALVAVLSAISAKAHQPDISSITLIEREGGHWILQLNASMTAFQYEVTNAYGKDAYTSPEEFNQLLLNHLREQIAIQVNGEDVILEKGWVQLGHATTAAFEISGVPEAIDEIVVENKAFKNIHNSQAVFTFVKEGIDKSRFILSEANDYQIHVSLKENQVLLAETSWNANRMTLSIMVLLSGLAGFLLYKTRFRKRTLTQQLD